jgi:integrase
MGRGAASLCSAQTWPVLPKILKREGFGQDVGRWFQRYGRRYVSSDKRKSLHSFRHTFITALNRAHVSEAIVAELAGHAHGNIDRDRYGHGFEVKQLRDAVEKLNFGVEGELLKLAKSPPVT